MTLGSILIHFARRLWWKIVGSPQYRSESERRQSRDHVTRAAIQSALARQEEQNRRRSGNVVQFDPKTRRSLWRAR